MVRGFKRSNQTGGAAGAAYRLPKAAALAGVLILSATASFSIAQTAPDATSAPAATATATAVPVNAIGANLNISPKRLSFDRTQRTASVYIFNQGTAPASFDIALVDRVMLPDGRITPLDEAMASPDTQAIAGRVHSAKPMLLTSPRRVTLAPGKGQTIRVRAAPGADLSEAEYRTHLTVTTVPPRDLGYSAEQAAEQKPEELKFLVSSVFGLSIPVIVRATDPDVSARIENVKLGAVSASADGVAAARTTPQVTLDLVRTGAHSLFGNLEVRATRGRGGEVIGVARGVGVYTEIDRRAVQIPLTRAPAKGEQIEVRFSDDDTAPGRLLAAGPLALR